MKWCAQPPVFSPVPAEVPAYELAIQCRESVPAFRIAAADLPPELRAVVQLFPEAPPLAPYYAARLEPPR